MGTETEYYSELDRSGIALTVSPCIDWVKMTKTIKDLGVETSNDKDRRANLVLSLMHSSDDVYEGILKSCGSSLSNDESVKLYKATYFLKSAYNLSSKDKVAVNAAVIARLERAEPLFDRVSFENIKGYVEEIEPSSLLAPIENFRKRQQNLSLGS